MKNFINNNWFKIIATLILFIAIGDHPYSYYQLTRWVTCIASFYTAYSYHNTHKTAFVWLFIALGILFNPIAPFYLEKETWQIFNLIGGVLFTISLFINKKNEN